MQPTWDLVAEYVQAGRPVIGIDEVGRGAWAGPVVAGAVILPPGLIIEGLNDSKLVPPARRVQLDQTIRHQAVAYGLGWVSAAEVDANGLSWAVAESGRRAIADIQSNNAIIVLDGISNYLSGTHDCIAIIKADSLVAPVAAGSIIAKVARDNYMAKLALQYPDYGFDKHVGYGTAAHKRALAERGTTVEHRHSYKPVKLYVHH